MAETPASICDASSTKTASTHGGGEGPAPPACGTKADAALKAVAPRITPLCFGGGGAAEREAAAAAARALPRARGGGGARWALIISRILDPAGPFAAPCPNESMRHSLPRRAALPPPSAASSPPSASPAGAPQRSSCSSAQAAAGPRRSSSRSSVTCGRAGGRTGGRGRSGRGESRGTELRADAVCYALVGGCCGMGRCVPFA